MNTQWAEVMKTVQVSSDVYDIISDSDSKMTLFCLLISHGMVAGALRAVSCITYALDKQAALYYTSISQIVSVHTEIDNNTQVPQLFANM